MELSFDLGAVDALFVRIVVWMNLECDKSVAARKVQIQARVMVYSRKIVSLLIKRILQNLGGRHALAYIPGKREHVFGQFCPDAG